MEHVPAFVGRNAERSTLSAVLDRTIAGQGTVATISGEPGIGKTRLVEELAREATTAGATVTWGHAYEQSGAPPFWPWIEALRTGMASVASDALRDLVGEERANVIDLLPELHDRVPDLEPAPSVPDATEARWLLFEAVTEVLRRLSASRPLVLLLEDVQWADSASLLLLRHVSQRLRGSRVLLIATYRDEALASAHPLQQALRSISRAEGSLRLELSGLPVDAVRRYLVEAGLPDEGGSLAEVVAERTAGNPFFLREVVSLIARSPSVDEALHLVPTAIREIIDQRLSELPEPVEDVVAYAAVAGRVIRFAELEVVAEQASGDLRVHIEQALAVGVLVEPSTGTYRFVHALMRDAVLDHLSATSQAGLHGEIGAALERHQPAWASGEGAAEIARHYIEAAQLDPRFGEHALICSVRAAEHAHESRAWEAAAEHYDDCVELLERGVTGADLAEILLRRGENRTAARRDRDAWRDLLTAADEFRRNGDTGGEARATLEAIRVWAPPERKLDLLSRVLDAEDLDPAARALLLAKRARLRSPDGRADADEAARLGGDDPAPELRAELLTVGGELHFADGEFDAAAPSFREAFELFDELGLNTDAVRLLGDEHDCHLIGGEYRRAIDAYPAIVSYARRTRQRLWEQIWLGDWAGFALMRGDLGRAQASLADAIPEVTWTYYTITIGIAEYTGTAPEAPLVPPVALAGGVPELARPVHALRARAAHFAGDSSAAREALAAWAELQDQHVVIGHGGAIVDGVLQEYGTPEMVQGHYDYLGRWPTARGSVSGSLDRFRGSLALRLGLLDEAGEHLDAAFAWCKQWDLAVETARCRHELASLSVARGDLSEARRELERAIEVFPQHGAYGYEAEARSLLDSLDPSSGSTSGVVSDRELKVLALLVAGQSNRQIGETLSISRFTAANHVKSILGKTGTTSRGEAAAYALAHGLVDPPTPD